MVDLGSGNEYKLPTRLNAGCIADLHYKVRLLRKKYKLVKGASRVC